MHDIQLVVTHDTALLAQAAQLIDGRDDAAHPLDHALFYRSRAVVVALTSTQKVVGCAAIKAGAGAVGELGFLVVSPSFRRQGIAKALTQRRIEVAKSLGITLLFATIRDENQISKANLLQSGFYFWRNYLSIRGTANCIGWYYLALDTQVDVDSVMLSLVGDRVLIG